MNRTFSTFWGELLKILEYPLFKLGEVDFTLLSLSKLLLLVGLVVGGERMLRRQFTLRVLRRTKMAPSLQYAVAKLLGYVFNLLGIYIALQLVGVNLTSLAILAGAVGVGIGFGLQNIVHNFVSGIIILAERPIAVGDRIEVGGVAGTVSQINLRSTTVLTNDNIAIIVPNSDFISHTVTNWSYGDPRVQMRLPVGVAYGSDVEKLRRVLLEVAAEHPKVLKDPQPTVFFEGFGESALNFELGVWTAEMTHAPRRFRSELYFAMERKLRENQIDIPFPQRDLHLRSGAFVLPPKDSSEISRGSGT